MPGYTHPKGFTGDLEIGRKWENDTNAHVLGFIGRNFTPDLQTFTISRFVFPKSEF